MTPKMIARKEQGIGWMIFNQPEKRNAVSFEMWQGMAEILDDFEADPAVRVIVLTGAGEESFVSGADISEFEQKRSTPEAVQLYDRTSGIAQKKLQGATKPVIAMIRGYCVGGGLAIALGCDIRICGSDSRFAVPAAKLGLGYAYDGIKRLTDIVGPTFAKEIFFTARLFDAEEARSMGLVNRVMAKSEVEAYVRDYAAKIAANAPLTVRAAKMAIEATTRDPERRQLDRVAEAVASCFASGDYIEGRRAFMEKRKPAFQGR